MKTLLSPDYLVLDGSDPSKVNLKDCDFDSDTSIVKRYNVDVNLLLGEESAVPKKANKVEETKEEPKGFVDVPDSTGDDMLDIFGGLEDGKEEKVEELKKATNTDISIESAIKKIAENKGIIFYRKNMGYKATNEVSSNPVKATSIEVAYPSIKFSATGVGVMLNFQGEGELDIDSILGTNKGKKETIKTFKSRYIKRDGEVKIKTLGVAFPNEVDLDFLSEIGEEERKAEFENMRSQGMMSDKGFLAKAPKEKIELEREKAKINASKVLFLQEDEAYICKKFKGFNGAFIYRWDIPDNVKEVDCDKDDLLTEDDMKLYKEYVLNNCVNKQCDAVSKAVGVKEDSGSGASFEGYSEEERKKIKLAMNPFEKSGDNNDVELAGKGWGKLPSGTDMVSGMIKGQKSLNEIQDEIINQPNAKKLSALYDSLSVQVNDSDKKKVDAIKEEVSKKTEELLTTLRKKVINGCYQGNYKSIVVKGNFTEEKEGVYTADNGLQIKTKLKVVKK